jgi:predicted solute-binding protein
LIPEPAKFKVRAVSFLNTVPLVWGMLHGPQKSEVDLSFSIPSDCARDVERGLVDIGLVPVAEIARQEMETVPGLGISCRGAVRSILLFSRVPWKQIKSLAADASSRTSVELARVILRERYGVEPRMTQQQPLLEEMLVHSDAALIIGDPALRIDPDASTYKWLDLGAEWFEMTGLPFVFAAWAGKAGLALNRLATITADSYSFGEAHVGEIADSQHGRRGISKELAHRYLTHHIRFVIGKAEQEGLEAFFELADLRRDLAARI